RQPVSPSARGWDVRRVLGQDQAIAFLVALDDGAGDAEELAQATDVALERALVAQGIVVAAPERARDGVAVEVAAGRAGERVDEAAQDLVGGEADALAAVAHLVRFAVDDEGAAPARLGDRAELIGERAAPALVQERHEIAIGLAERGLVHGELEVASRD